MAIIQSGADPTLWTIDPDSNAGRVTLYDINGNPIGGINTIEVNRVLGALNETLIIDLTGQATASVQLYGTTGTFTVGFQASINDGYSWFFVNGYTLGTDAQVSSVSSDGIWFIDVSGYNAVRLLVTSYTSGSTNAYMIAAPEERRILSSNFTIIGTGSDNSINSSAKLPVLSAIANTSNPTWTNGYMVPLSVDTSGNLRVTGTLIETNASISPIGSSPPGSATYIGASVTTLAPSYVNGQINALSLTTGGLLRIDGSGVTQPVSGAVTANQGGAPWSQNITQFGGTNISTGTGIGGVGIPRVTVSNDSNVLSTQSGIWTVQPGNTANTTPWLATINQGGNSAIVKAASVPAVATDSALVVSISPNNAISVSPVTVSQSDTTNTGTLNALNAAVSVTLAGTCGTAMQLLAGTLIGTIVPEVSVDGGTTWVTTFFDDLITSNKTSSIVFGANNTAQTKSIMGSSGASHVRIRVSAFTSGTATCNLRATSQNDATVFFDGSAGSALAPTIAQVGGAVTTAAPAYTTATMNALSLTTSGALRIDGSSVTQPVSGTITANQGIANTLTNAWPTKITDATNGPVAVKVASTPAAAIDPALVVSLSPNSHAKATIQPLYGTNGQTVAITLASLANAAARASTAISNTTNLYEDVLLFVKITTAAAGVSTTGYVNVYGYGTVDGGTNYPDAITGTDAGVTLTTPPNLVILAQINANTNGATKTYGPFSFCRQYGIDRLPASWGIVIVNQTGAVFNATAGNFLVEYQGINSQLV